MNNKGAAVTDKQPWMFSAKFDSVFITTPGIWITLAIIIFQDEIAQLQTMPLWVWVVFILCIDVAHVYATLFRTYLNKDEFNKHRSLFTMAPLLIWVGGAILYSVDDLLFWRVLAYVAVFHFIRQQYGFMRLYSRKETHVPNWSHGVDQAFIYACTLYPVIFWHANLPRNYHWFVDDDFISGLPTVIEKIGLFLFIGIAAIYVGKETFNSMRYKHFNCPKNILALGTALSWHVGIVTFNGDIAFSVINVVSHGIPYMALIWVYGRKQETAGKSLANEKTAWLTRLFQPRWCSLYVALLICLAFIEEGLWNGLIWREHLAAFPLFSELPRIEDKAALALLVSLLSLPQTTHYVLDGFIWKMRDEKAEWKNILFQTQSIGR